MSNVEKEPGPDSPEQAVVETPVDGEKKKREYKDFGHEDEKPTRMFLTLTAVTVSDLICRRQC